MNMTAESRVFQYAAFAFDVSMMDIFSTMVCGGCVCMPSERDRLGNFTPIMNQLKVNWVLFTPSVASLLKPEDVPSLQNLAFGGEAVKEENITRWSGKVNLFNCYGPAECCACSIGKFESEGMRPSNIGRQFGGGLNWVVNPEDHDRLMPIGCVGELAVEGPTLARGYLGDVAKTKASFIKSPAWPGSANGARRVYLTGDLVRQNSDGTFEFVGRKDHQLKIRGQRVELGEIEHHLAKYPKVALSAVLRPLSGSYAQRLVAIIQLQQIDGTVQKQFTRIDLLSKEELSAAHFDQTATMSSLKLVLPVYMIPQHLIVVKNLPLSLSGKIDRRAVEAWLQTMTRLVELKAEVVNVNRNSHGFPQGECHIASEICLKISSMVAPTDAGLCEILKGSNLSLASLALDSIQFIALTMFIRQRFGVDVELETLIHPQATVSSIAKAVKALKCCDEIQAAEPTLDAADFFQTHRMKALKRLARDKRRGENVFLTGATGFLGSRILYSLCKDVRVLKVFVHIRLHSSEQTSNQSLHRIIHSAQKGGWWRAEYVGKLEIWTGDLAKPKLGLSSSHWSRLCGHGTFGERVSTIIHNGAIVNWNSSFDSLRAANVDSTMELLAAAAESPALEHFVFVSGGQQLKLEVDNDVEIAAEVMRSTGYAQSKFLSELIVKDYASKAAPPRQHIAIVKPGYIIGSLEHGETPAGDYIWRLAATCAFNRAYNAADASSWLFVSDVDRVASAVVEACSFSTTNRVEDCDAKIVKILDGIPVQDFWRLIGEELGCKVQALAPDAWMERIFRDVESRSEKHPLWPLLYTLEKGNGLIGTLVDHHSKIAFDRPRVSAALRKNIDYLKSNGTLQTPEEH
ncbi:MAG: putative NRPS-like protein biosynthetic cluster [Ramalina farinacea]|uniref:NRPS-like protein biosynthetic cluster n=1 Tax=Ramalina farinacea TaxID=258253 RepID=A0AA43TVH2_9LECA|nr:putative NRPS-like protein biosynthetic cluster [Ramalina farinacea]